MLLKYHADFANDSYNVKNVEIHVLAFFKHNILSIASVSSPIHTFAFLWEMEMEHFVHNQLCFMNHDFPQD